MTVDPFAYPSRLVPARPDLAATHLKGRVTAQTWVTGTDYTVSASILDLHMKPDAAAGLATQLLFGETFTAFETRPDGFSWGQAPGDQYVGYVRTDGLGPYLGPGQAITAPRSHVYSAANIKAPTCHALPCLAQVHVDGTEGKFASLADGGHVPSVHLAPVTGDFVDQALRFLNVPYLWGGRSFEGIDCSGLVQVALLSTGQSAPRDSDMQQAWLGQELTDDAPLRRGDLIFWKGHVGIMLDGSTLLHANAFHMAVAQEKLDAAMARIASAGDGPVTCRRRLA